MTSNRLETNDPLIVPLPKYDHDFTSGSSHLSQRQERDLLRDLLKAVRLQSFAYTTPQTSRR